MGVITEREVFEILKDLDEDTAICAVGLDPLSTVRIA